jgi:hypothetical protein
LEFVCPELGFHHLFDIELLGALNLKIYLSIEF